jgi:hypothetical protein
MALDITDTLFESQNPVLGAGTEAVGYAVEFCVKNTNSPAFGGISVSLQQAPNFKWFDRLTILSKVEG